MCTGAVIGVHWILTTATCLSEPMKIEGIVPRPKNPNDIYVVLGIEDLYKSDASDSRVVKQIKIYPKFKSQHVFNVGFVQVCILNSVS